MYLSPYHLAITVIREIFLGNIFVLNIIVVWEQPQKYMYHIHVYTCNYIEKMEDYERDLCESHFYPHSAVCVTICYIYIDHTMHYYFVVKTSSSSLET